MKKRILYLIAFLAMFGINSKLFAQRQIIDITSKVNDDKSIDLSYTKEKPGTYTVILEFSNVENCDVTNYKTEIYGNSGYLYKLKPTNTGRGIRYSMKYYTMMGKQNPKVDSLFQYTLPFKNGKKVKIYEAGNIGEKYLGQEKKFNWKSYVVKPKDQDTICNMRKGIVVDIINDYADNSTSDDPYYTSKRNSVVVEHADGTFAVYKGFKKNAIFVKLGETVYPQTELGLIEKYDLNGYRLDFSVYFSTDKNIDENKNQTLKSFKSRYKYITPHFVTPEGTITIESGKEYTALLNESVITQEFSRSEKKKYAKTHSLSN
ncbi:hypothetical protein [Flavobacterium gilvum]|uniref:Peptidase M23 domain-containing protein n=1 Tax=Flavobacterium gilvum TaxID=1492737 RepID=A0AAC9I4D8_9FLAO|nr:hypothetical protein [Flavobacterium gilvum]AOW10174.1 hypothetical protein EM308_12030 [Flavobacterium gilvum]KFC57655.1 hypothetical protein FEM08_35600 [Flavobacterium gilvum]